MSLLLRLLTCTALLFASAASVAGAATPQALAVSIAQQHWAASPCDGDVKILTRQRGGGGHDAWVTFATPIGDNNLSADAATYTELRRSPSRATAGRPAPACSPTGTCSA